MARNSKPKSLAEALNRLPDNVFEEIMKNSIRTFNTKEEMDLWLEENNVAEDQVVTERGQHARTFVKKVGRNAKCPCGSGLKYKKCCLLNNNVGIG